MSAYPWNFATKRASLPALATAPTWGFKKAYQLPSDYLRMIELEDDTVTWKVEGKTIVCDQSAPLNILYIAQITDVVQFTSLFEETLTERLAAELAVPITKKIDIRNGFLQTYIEKLSEARTLDGQEGTQDVQEISDLIDVR
jgi:hypothetical protein